MQKNSRSLFNMPYFIGPEVLWFLSCMPNKLGSQRPERSAKRRTIKGGGPGEAAEMWTHVSQLDLAVSYKVKQMQS